MEETLIGSQNRRLRAWLEAGRTINPMIALNEMGIMRLASRIHDLREMYHLNISGRMVSFGKKKYKMYWLENEESN